MKYSTTSINAAMLALTTSSSLLHKAAFASSSEGQVEQQRLRGRRLVQSEGCIVTKVLTEIEGDQGSTEGWECELQSADANQAGVQFVTLEGLDDVDLDVEAISGVTTLLAEGAEIVNGSLKVPRGSRKQWDKVEKRGPSEKKDKKDKKDKQDNRLLAPINTVTPRTVLAVRVTGLDDATSATSKKLSDDIFGTDGSPVNLVERFNSCSHGDMQMQPATGSNILNGVAEVVINKNVKGVESSVIQDAVLAELKKVVGKEPSSSFDHVMLCLPPGTSGGWIAYGYLNSWLTVYNDEWCRYPSGQVHELGHNLGLNHANEGTEAYGDQTGMMGYSYGSFNTKMCYNPAKSWQLGWYSKQREEVDMTQQNELQRTLVGIIAYDNSGSAPQRVHLKIKGTTAHPQPLYVGFNRAAGFNDGTVEAPNQVTVIGQTSTELSYLEAKLSSGGQYVIPKYLNGVDLIIKVNEISTSANPAFADVTIKLDVPPPKDPTPAPPSPPTDPNVPPPEDPTPIDPNTWNDVVTETFTGNMGIFTTASSADAKLAKYWKKAVGGKSAGSMYMAGITKASTKLGYQVADYKTLKIDFSYYSVLANDGNWFALETSSDDGSTWKTVKTFTKGALGDWSKDKGWQNGTYEWPVDAGVKVLKFRIRTFFTKVKKLGLMYVDDFKVQGK